MKLVFRKKKQPNTPSPNKKVMMDNFFDDFCVAQARSNIVRDKFDTSSFVMTISDKGTRYKINAELPGVKEKNIDVKYEKEHLTVSACKSMACLEKGLNFLQKESRLGCVSKSYKIDPIDEASIKVVFRKGLLEITMDKRND